MKVLPSSKDKEKKYRKIQKALDKEFELHELDQISNSSEESDGISAEFEIHPLSYYIDNREDLIQHMFATIKGAKLKRMVPPALRHLTTEELKADCLIQVLGLSKKRILYTIDGKELNSSSDDSDSGSSDSSLDIEKEAKALKLLQEKAAGKKSKHSADGKGGKKRKSIQLDSDTEADGKVSKKKKKKRSKEEKQAESIDLDPEEEDKEGEGEEDGKKKLIELIELEMRARAIRKLLGK
ncbi:caspase activity and apoptosis inhibitor 1-like [Diaphorina citri]|uniref:Caspase activity and apoptosis inhibitor 1-like n=1 Tax=Diaphorina citri TaxID=121845 RepID=A0A3Q0ITT9_DIACI|nr:caspase activity and apoptosis inhibitor 1-like [Diaphorina citri]